MDHNLSLHVEALIFISQDTITGKEIKDCLSSRFGEDIGMGAVKEAIIILQEKYKDDSYAYELSMIGNGYKFMTKGAYYDTIATFLRQTTEKRLSKAAMETLALVAYKQPVTRSELEAIRGVNCDYSLQKLLEKELVEITGRSEGPGRPLLYGTSEKFMDYFGISSLDDLPKTKDFKLPESTVGEPAPLEEEVIDLKTEEE